MRNRRQHGVREELGVLISLAVSLGMIILAVAGLWLWRIISPITHTAFLRHGSRANPVAQSMRFLLTFLDLLAEIVFQAHLFDRP